MNIETRTLEQVKSTLEQDSKKPGDVDIRMARLMVKFGNVTDDAREYAKTYLNDRGIKL